MLKKERIYHILLGSILSLLIYATFFIVFWRQGIDVIESLSKAIWPTFIFLAIPVIIIVLNLSPLILFKRPIRSISSFYKSISIGPLIAFIFAIGWYFYQHANRFGEYNYFSQLSSSQAKEIIDSIDLIEGNTDYKIIVSGHEKLDSLDKQTVFYQSNKKIKIFEVLIGKNGLLKVLKQGNFEDDMDASENFELIERIHNAKEIMDSLKISNPN